MKQLNPILSNDPNYYLRFTNKNPKVIKNYYAYKYIQKRRRFLKNMDKMLMLNNYHNTYYPELGIKTKLFTPFNLKSVPAYYYNLISVITEYFSCKAIWIKRFPKQTIDPINTFIIVGHLPDVYMCHKLISFEINNIQQLHFNKTRQHVKKVIKKHKKRKPNKSANARTVASKYIKKLIHNMFLIWERLLESKNNDNVIYGIKLEKTEKIYKYSRDNKLLDFGKRDWVNTPNISNAFCRENKFCKNKIIVYKSFTSV